MILHLGNDLVVYERDIIIIIDAGCTEARNNQEFWDSVRVAGWDATGAEAADTDESDAARDVRAAVRTAPDAQDKPKSYVLVQQEGECVVYPSPISSQTLLKRINSSDYGMEKDGSAKLM